MGTNPGNVSVKLYHTLVFIKFNCFLMENAMRVHWYVVRATYFVFNQDSAWPKKNSPRSNKPSSLLLLRPKKMPARRSSSSSSSSLSSDAPASFYALSFFWPLRIWERSCVFKNIFATGSFFCGGEKKRKRRRKLNSGNFHHARCEKTYDLLAFAADLIFDIDEAINKTYLFFGGGDVVASLPLQVE